MIRETSRYLKRNVELCNGDSIFGVHDDNVDYDEEGFTCIQSEYLCEICQLFTHLFPEEKVEDYIEIDYRDNLKTIKWEVWE